MAFIYSYGLERHVEPQRSMALIEMSPTAFYAHGPPEQSPDGPPQKSPDGPPQKSPNGRPEKSPNGRPEPPAAGAVSGHTHMQTHV